MVAKQPAAPPGINHANYFVIVENCFHGRAKGFRYFIRIIYFVDVIICTSYYFKITGELTESLLFDEPIDEKQRPGYLAAVYIVVAFFLIGFEYAEKYITTVQSPAPEVKNRVDIHNVHVNSINVEMSTAGEGNNLYLNMKDVVEETHTYDWKRSVLLFLIMCFTFVCFATWLSIYQDNDLMNAANETLLCPGIKKLVLFGSLDSNILLVIPVITYALMNYVIFLPICPIEKLDTPLDYADRIRTSGIILTGIYTFLPLLVVHALEDSVPVLFPVAFGYTIYGQLLSLVALAIALFGMLLRSMGCCKLIQALFLKTEGNAHDRFWLIMVLLFLVSFVTALWSPSVMHLTIVAGSVTCNILLIIIPRVAYIRFKMDNNLQNGNRAIGISIAWALIVIVLHVYLLLKTPKAIEIAGSYVEKPCRLFFTQYWNHEDSQLCSVSL